MPSESVREALLHSDGREFWLESALRRVLAKVGEIPASALPKDQAPGTGSWRPHLYGVRRNEPVGENAVTSFQAEDARSFDSP